KPLIPHAPETSFPSDHATLLFGAALALLFRPGWRGKGAFLLLVAMIGAWGRVYTGLHFPFDILGSLGVALSAVLVVVSIRWALTPLYDTVIRTVDHVTALVTRKERLTS
ncbi:MAG TPA: phosphatase PAP2 family protein, partial [Desulfobulbus sp.]|nr:phosphatase PAP2 family protein [Desulfobulbus sp.]